MLAHQSTHFVGLYHLQRLLVNAKLSLCDEIVLEGNLAKRGSAGLYLPCLLLRLDGKNRFGV
ncbi:hypothetical protein BD408DRAFT_421773 [Parasitella parasitica]|nr:hypothetical protein BD408DRAFT_421773 [Parasitella parasitica]